jgi:hypothetical protein
LPGCSSRARRCSAAQGILRGVERNQPVIAFPRYMSFAWRLACLFPRSLDRTVLPTLRELRTCRPVPDLA